MSRMIKLSKSDWLRIGREQGYIKSSQTLGRTSPLLQLEMAVIDAAKKMKDVYDLNATGFKASEEMNAKIKSVTKGLQEIVRELPPSPLVDDDALDEAYRSIFWPAAALDPNHPLTERLIEHGKRHYGTKDGPKDGS